MLTEEQPTVAVQVWRHRSGDRAATEALARRAATLALRTAAAILRDRDEAGDVAQDVAVDVLRSLGKLRDPERFDAWVHRIAVRHVQRRLRRWRLRRDAETSLSDLDPGLEPAAPGADRAAEIAVREALAAALAELPAKQRIALALRYVHDLPDAEIAAALGCSVGNVHSLLSRGRSSLRRNRQLTPFAPSMEEG
jgi:RNA polymerase sigma-70 factor (ECF subfamily)